MIARRLLPRWQAEEESYMQEAKVALLNPHGLTHGQEEDQCGHFFGQWANFATPNSVSRGGR